MTRGHAIRLVAIAAALLVATPAAAGAHAFLVSSSPADGTVLEARPGQLSLRFSEPPEVAVSHVALVGSDGRSVELPLTSRGGGVVTAGVPAALARGSYTVHWRTVGRDGHPSRGAFRFGVGQPVAPPQPEPGQGPAAPADILRWLYFVALGVTAGALLFQASIVEPSLRRLRGAGSEAAQAVAWRRTAFAAAAGAFAALELDLLGYFEWTHEIVGGGWHAFTEAQIQDLRSGTARGQAWTATTFGWLVVLALIGLAHELPARRRALSIAAGCMALACGAGLSLTGHAAAHDGTVSLATLADFLHLVTAALWLGGVVALAIVAWPLARRLADDDGRALLVSVVLRLSAILTGVVAVVALTGLYLAVRRLHGVGDLTHGWGLVLTIKSVAVAASLAAGAYHRFVLVPRLLAGDRPPARPRSLRLESALIATVLLIAAVLTNAGPPR